MPDDERTRRRLGDATKSNIADLADGWTTPKADPEPVAPAEPVAAAPAPRSRPKTQPPPPPGSEARRVLESQILDAAALAPVMQPPSGPTTSAPPPGRTRPPPSASQPPPPPRRNATMPPPVPPPRAKPPTTQQPIVQEPIVRFKPTTQPPPAKPTTQPPPLVVEPEPVIALDKPKPRALTSPFPAVAMNAAARPAASVTGSSRVVKQTTPPAMPFIPPPGPATYVDILPIGERAADDTLNDTSQPTTPQAKSAAPFATPAQIEAAAASAPVHSAVTTTGKVPVVPLGEFDDGPGTFDDGKQRQLQQAQRTMKRDAAEALLKMPPPAPPPLPKPPPKPAVLEISSVSGTIHGEPTAVDAQYERGDPTSVSPNNELSSTSLRGPAATLRAGAALRRKRGLAGDVRYVFTALFGVRRTRTEIADLQIRQDTKQKSRRRHLVTLGRTAMLSEYKHAAMDESRVVFEEVEDQRSGHAGQVAAADAELDRVRRDRESLSKKNTAETAALDAELAVLAKKLEPLDKEIAAVQKRGDALREQLAKLDQQISFTQNSLISVKGQRLDKAAVSAEVATLRADRQAVQRDEPIIAAELDTLQPRIAALRGQRATAQQRRADIVASEEQDKRRIEELLTAIGAKRKVVDRAAADAETARDNVLFDLGDKLYTDRPKKLAAQLAPIDEIDLELGENERRMMELREILSNVDKRKLTRGIGVIVAFVLLFGGAAAYVLVLALGR